MAPFDLRFDPRQRRHLIRAHLVSQLIRVQLMLPINGFKHYFPLTDASCNDSYLSPSTCHSRRKWKFIQKYLKKNIQKSRWQISGSIKDHFAGENGVCEISQTLKRAAKYFRNNKLNSQGCEIGFLLEVLSVPACGMYRVALGGIP
uniref:Uncharacterized protein n=1 Tax=Vitis vinifera TaxID=29760 RepID=A5AH35_VITVI|nr:hypothetical protein VITISV_016770 [Vitis vinifera]